jgi:hypothetical protein
MNRWLIGLSILVASVAGALAQSTDATAEGKRWWPHIQFLADDKLEGRNVGTPGFEKAIEYAEGQFRAIGLQPGGASGFRQPLNSTAGCSFRINRNSPLSATVKKFRVS